MKVKTLIKNTEAYNRMTIMRKAFRNNGNLPELFKPERIAVNNIMGILDSVEVLNEIQISSINQELIDVENSTHYDGSGWMDFKLHLDSFLTKSGYNVFWDQNNLLQII